MNEKDYELFKEFIHSLLYELTSIDDYYTIMDNLGVPRKKNKFKTCCHNETLGNDVGYNLSFNEDTRSFYCFSHCCQSFNLVTLLEQVFEIRGEYKKRFQVCKYICDTLNIPFNFKDDNKPIKKVEYDWKKALGKYATKIDTHKDNEVYDKSVLDFLDTTYHTSFLDDNISIETMQKYMLRFYSRLQQICIPVYSDMGELIGIHSRNLDPYMIELGFKYLPLKLLNGMEYNFSTSNVLFGLNLNKENIYKTKSAIILESPKGVMQMEDILTNNISVGLFGMVLQKPKRDLLIKYGVNSVYIALDKQYETVYEYENGEPIVIDGEYVKTKEFVKYEEKVMKIADDLKSFVQNIYVIYDTDDSRLLGYKDSPSDKGKEIWNELYKNKERIY